MYPATSTRRRFAATLAAVLVLFVTAMPATAVCCLVKSGNQVASMHAAMPCCAETCTMSNPNGSRDSNVAVAALDSPQVGAGPGVAVVFPATAATITTVSTATERTRNDFSAPPPFLAHAQFRI